MFPKCGYTAQSPIDFETNLVVINETLGRFNRSIFGKVTDKMIYKNNGHTRKLLL